MVQDWENVAAVVVSLSLGGVCYALLNGLQRVLRPPEGLVRPKEPGAGAARVVEVRAKDIHEFRGGRWVPAAGRGDWA
jgi:hypothetical protein